MSDELGWFFTFNADLRALRLLLRTMQTVIGGYQEELRLYRSNPQVDPPSREQWLSRIIGELQSLEDRLAELRRHYTAQL